MTPSSNYDFPCMKRSTLLKTELSLKYSLAHPDQSKSYNNAKRNLYFFFVKRDFAILLAIELYVNTAGF